VSVLVTRLLSSSDLYVGKNMKRIMLRTGFLGLIVAATAAAGGPLTACSPNAPNPASSANPASSVAATPSVQGMDHGKMMPQGGGMHHMGMDLGPADAEFDLRFIDAMTPHHQGAVEMAKAAQQKSKRPEIQKLAAAIISSQDQEIAQMKQWRQAWYPKAGGAAIAYNAQMGHAMPMTPDQKGSMMMSMDLGAADAQFDLRFINAMVPHHEGAVTMAQDVLSKSKRPEVQKLAKAIIASQTAEISQMQQWRKAWYKQ
jgi:uncharacterized protein (DUF305 family)